MLSCFVRQTPKPSGVSPTLLTAARALCTSKLRSYLSPHVEMPDSSLFAPVPVCLGTKPVLAWILMGAIQLTFLKKPVGRTRRKSAEKSARLCSGDCFTAYETTWLIVNPNTSTLSTELHNIAGLVGFVSFVNDGRTREG